MNRKFRLQKSPDSFIFTSHRLRRHRLRRHRRTYLSSLMSIIIRKHTSNKIKGPESATPLFLFACENLAIIFYSEPVETKKNQCETSQDN